MCVRVYIHACVYINVVTGLPCVCLSVTIGTDGDTYLPVQVVEGAEEDGSEGSEGERDAEVSEHGPDRFSL